MDEDAKRLLSALRQDVAGRQKFLALTVYADATPATAEARFSRLLAGEFGDAVWRTLALVLRGEAHATLAVLSDLASVDFTARRRDPAATLEQVSEQLALQLEALGSLAGQVETVREELAERRGPVRTAAKPKRETA